MNKLKTIIFAASSLVLVNLGTATADSGNFAGPYVGISISGYGMALDGQSSSTSTDVAGDAQVTETDEVPVGATTPISGFEAGYAIPLGSAVLLDVGATYMNGEAKLDHTGDDSDTVRNVSFKIDDLRSIYIAPTLVLSDTSSLYIKAGLSEADVTVSGDITSPANLSGQTWGMGSRTVLDNGIFIRTEAGYTEYNGIAAHGKGSTIQTTTAFSAEPSVADGQGSLGFRF